MRKCISLSNHDLELLEHCKKENGLTSDLSLIHISFGTLQKRKWINI